MATIREIAQLAEVSPATVSRVLNMDETFSVSNSTRQRVIEIAKRLNYQSTKRNKYYKNRKYVGLLLSDSSDKGMTSTMEIRLYNGIKKQCKNKNIELIKVFRGKKTGWEESLKALDGIISLVQCSEKEVYRYYSRCRHIVFINGNGSLNLYDSVVSDMENGIKKVVNYFMACGHKQIGFIGKNNEIAELFMTYMKSLHLYNRAFIRLESEKAKENNYLATYINKQGLPTALLIEDYSLAKEFVSTLSDQGVIVPKDLSVASLNPIIADHSLLSEVVVLSAHYEYMGSKSIDLLMERLTENRTIPIRLIVPMELIVKSSK